MNFNELGWAAVCFYYRSIGDAKYCKIMKDTKFIVRLRETPSEIDPEEFEQKVILDYINIQSYDLLIEHRLASTILNVIIKLQPELSLLHNTTLLDCDLSDSRFKEQINNIYFSFSSIYGLWQTGVSKIMHLLNDKLFVMLDLSISDDFGLLKDGINISSWFGLAQINVREVTKDFQERGYSGSPEQFISRELGYTKYGCEKSIVKFLDEYFWLRHGDHLPIPPRWIPS
ncbi:hypothetical protein ACFLTP_04785 [Chloroflexota bacterium]